ncbi:MAG: hypothetical protein JW819_03275 [Candidatus Krumholzibacteriota bacterium]|nr:hypothetical protein [Candidatus Krumholzibacteriota bacterium]
MLTLTKPLRCAGLAALALLLVANTTLAGAGDFPHPRAPRVANYYLRTDIAGKEALLSQWDLLILPYQLLDDELASIQAIRALNPDQITLAYIDPMQIPEFPSDVPGHIQHDLVAGVDSLWIAYNELGDTIRIWPNSIHVNYTDVCPVVSGERYRDYFIRYVSERFFPLVDNGTIDGLFLDEMSIGGYLWWDPLFDGTFDYDLDGAPDAPDSLEAWLDRALSDIADSLAATIPAGGLLLGNNCKPYQPSLHGKFYESFPASWESWLAGTLNDVDIWNSLADGQNITTLNGLYPQPYDTRQFRFRLAASLLTDNYFSYDSTTNDHYQVIWYDLFDVDLGLPVGPRFTIGETPLAVSDFEAGMGDWVEGNGLVCAWEIVDDPGLVLQGQHSLLVEITTPGAWPSPLKISVPGGYLAGEEYTFSMQYRILDAELDETRLIFKSYTEEGTAADNISTPSIRSVAGCQGLLRTRLALNDFDDYLVYFKTEGRVTMVVDSISVVRGQGGLWAREYENGLVVCNDTDNVKMFRNVPPYSQYVLPDADGQLDHYPTWNGGSGIGIMDRDGLVFQRGGTAVPAGPAPAAPAVALGRPYPNPCNPAFSVRLDGLAGTAAAVTLHDVRGRRLAELWRGVLPASSLDLTFRDELAALPSGVYLLRAAGANGNAAVRRVVLLR